MKYLLSLILLLFYLNSNATIYYFSSVSGNDSYSNIQAQNATTPWRSIDKMNSFFSNFSADDSLLFKRGEIFYGCIVANNSGLAGKNIFIGAYGSGAKPIITGLNDVFTWTNIGANLWESSSPVSTLLNCKMVVIENVNTHMGRYPNTSSTLISGGIHNVPGNNGWLNYESFLGTGQFTDNELTGSPNWTGAEAVVKKYNWVVDHGKITDHTNGTITFLPSVSDTLISGMSYFIQNDIRTLDEQNEWYYNPSTKKLTVYSIGSPTGVKVATLQNLFVRNNNNYITLDNLDFRGSNDHLIDLGSVGGSNGIEIKNCNIEFAGNDGIWSNGSDVGGTYNNNTVSHCNNNGINLMILNDGNITITNNTLSYIGIYPGMTMMNSYGNGSGTGIHCEGGMGLNGSITIRYNKISHTGFDGIVFLGNNSLVSNNLIQDFCIMKTDGAGIYTWGGGGQYVFNNMVIEDNIVINGSDLGDIGTANEASELSVNGIYLDGQTSNVIIRRNSISHVNASGIYMNSPHNCEIKENTVYDARYAQIHCNKHTGTQLLNLTVKHNIAVARNLNTFNGLSSSTASSQRCFYYKSQNDDLVANIISDSNFYGRPIDNDLYIPVNPSPGHGSPGFGQWGTMNYVYGPNYLGYGEYGPMSTFTLAGWKAVYPTLDQHSQKAPKSISSVFDLRFEYNETSSNKTINLGVNYVDMKGITYPGTITIPPFKSVILIKNDTTNIPPVAEAGPNQTITIPVSSVNIPGSGVDHDGLITSYNWKKISGPSTGNLLNTTSPSTSAYGLVGGIYKFELKVTDDKGAIGKDTTTIIYQAFLVPISLLDFSVSDKLGKSLLHWATSTEINSSHFEVERSNDGRNFETIGTVNANGNTNSRVDYQLFDYYPETGVNYYRLKIINKDGQFEYSKTISIVFKSAQSGSVEIKSVYIKDKKLQLNLASSKNQSVTIGMYDAIGQELFVSNIVLQKGMNTINKGVMQPSAVYYFKLKSTEETKAMPLFNE